jgi:hypothetical protein
MTDTIKFPEITTSAVVLEQKKLASKIEKTGDVNVELSEAEKAAALAKATADALAKAVKEENAAKRKAKNQAKKEEAQIAKQEETEEEKIINEWNAFVIAKNLVETTDMNFFRDGQAKYFNKLMTTTVNPKSGVVEYETDIKYYPPHSLKDNWLEFKNERVLIWFRKIIDGGKITVKNPETDELITFDFESRLYEKLTNTVRQVDSKVYNLLDLSDKLVPNYNKDEKQECPPILKALLYSCSGNEITWNEETNQWDCDKQENLDWYEKWVYGTVHADIGNPMASMPVTFGSGKVGQNALADIVFPSIMGRQTCMSTIWDVIHGNFDGFKLGKVFIFIDEVPERDDWNRLKNMTGSPQAFVRQKYGAEFTIDNCIRYALSSNSETYPGPVENGRQMERYSPIKKNPKSTFAENTVKILDKIHGENYCRNLLKEYNDSLDVDTMSDFAVGDSLLRTALADQWQSREAGQQLLNYLDQTYASSKGSYSNPPLRGRDWSEIIQSKGNINDKVTHYCVDQDIDTITINELYEIYKVLQSERNDSPKKINGFAATIKPLMEEVGYKAFGQASIAGGTRTTVYSKTSDDFAEYQENVDRFIVTANLSDDTFHKATVRRLRWEKKSSINDELKAKLAKFKGK